VNGILLIFYHPPYPFAPTVLEHIRAFERYSRFKVWKLNTASGFPEGLSRMRFDAVVLHYSTFFNGMNIGRFSDYIKQCQSSYKVAFFQDEHWLCQQRFDFLNQHKIDCLYTLVEPRYFADVYGKYTSVPRIIYNLPGYVSDDLIREAQKMARPDENRSIDIGYRGRKLPFYMGKGGQEKSEIGIRFKEAASKSELKLDIEVDEDRRIYGQSWSEFVSDCRAMLGVEAGVSIFDIEGVVRSEYEHLIESNLAMSFEEASERLLSKWEDNIQYRTISPRHFEAAAFRVCQILFEGNYSAVLQPMKHYIPLKKDFSNFDDVIRMFRDETRRRELTENAYTDLIASGKYTYKSFINSFDDELISAGLQPDISDYERAKVSWILARSRASHKARAIRDRYSSLTKNKILWLARRILGAERTKQSLKVYRKLKGNIFKGLY